MMEQSNIIKQFRVKPIERIEDDAKRFYRYYCPTCGRDVGLSGECKCGQLIDWSFIYKK